jgi:hypothetical protein
MAQAILDSADIDDTWSLLRFAVEAWIGQIGHGSTAERLKTITTDRDSLRRLDSGLTTLKKLARTPTDSTSLRGKQEERRKVRELVRTLDAYLAQEGRSRTHLWSFYCDVDLWGAFDLDDVHDPDGLAQSWAAGPSRSKHEVLLRGRLCASLLRTLRKTNQLDAFFNSPARPASPYRPGRTGYDLCKETVSQLVDIVCLPPSSGGASAIQSLAVIGKSAIKEIDRRLFGGGTYGAPGSLGSAPAWRLTRVLTRIGQMLADSELAEQVWSLDRFDVDRRASELLAKILNKETPNINRSRSLSVEAFRFLSPHDEHLRNVFLARLERGRTVTIDTFGEVREVPPFGERGLLLPREQSYTAFVLCALQPDSAPQIAHILREKVDSSVFSEMTDISYAARCYSAAYVEYYCSAIPDEDTPRTPPLDAFLTRAQVEKLCSPQSQSNLGIHVDVGKVRSWFRADLLPGGDPFVIEPALTVWEALSSKADDNELILPINKSEKVDPSKIKSRTTLLPKSWRESAAHESAVRNSTLDFDRLCKVGTVDQRKVGVPFECRRALRSLVAQALLSVDGTGRRQAIECLRQAGLENYAAALFSVVVTHIRSKVRGGDPKLEAPLSWLHEQAVFCLSYCGSLLGFDELAIEAGLTSNVVATERSREPWCIGFPLEVGTEWEPNSTGAQGRTNRWIRQAALLGLADLCDGLHDAEGKVAEARRRLLLEGAENRLLALAEADDESRLRYAAGSGGVPAGISAVAMGGELRAIVALLAMLRSEDPASIRLLWILSGRFWEPAAMERHSLIEVERDLTSYEECLLPRMRGPRPKTWRNATAINWHLKKRPHQISPITSQGTAGTLTYEYSLEPLDAWQKYVERMSSLLEIWDHASWQLAEWGLQRIETRFRGARGDITYKDDEARLGGFPVVERPPGTRIVSPQEACACADERMIAFFLAQGNAYHPVVSRIVKDQQKVATE